jgi:hypothetical protein
MPSPRLLGVARLSGRLRRGLARGSPVIASRRIPRIRIAVPSGWGRALSRSRFVPNVRACLPPESGSCPGPTRPRGVGPRCRAGGRIGRIVTLTGPWPTTTPPPRQKPTSTRPRDAQPTTWDHRTNGTNREFAGALHADQRDAAELKQGRRAL